MDKRKRLKRLPPRPTPMTFDFETRDGLRVDFKMAQHVSSAHYGMQKMQFAGIENRIIKNIKVKSGVAIYDEIASFQPPTHAERYSMSVEEWRWSVAFNVCMGVNDKFYAMKSPRERREIEHQYETLAAKNTTNGRRAARVIASFTAYRLERS